MISIVYNFFFILDYAYILFINCLYVYSRIYVRITYVYTYRAYDKILRWPDNMSGNYILYAYKFSRDFIFANFANQWAIAKIKT